MTIQTYSEIKYDIFMSAYDYCRYNCEIKNTTDSWGSEWGYSFNENEHSFQSDVEKLVFYVINGIINMKRNIQTHNLLINQINLILEKNSIENIKKIMNEDEFEEYYRDLKNLMYL